MQMLHFPLSRSPLSRPRPRVPEARTRKSATSQGRAHRLPRVREKDKKGYADSVVEIQDATVNETSGLRLLDSRLSPRSPRSHLVAVGTPVARRPPHGSVREVLPHTALTSGLNDQSLGRIRMQDFGSGKPTLRQTSHPFPSPLSSFLTSSPKSTQPETFDLSTELA